MSDTNTLQPVKRAKSSPYREKSEFIRFREMEEAKELSNFRKQAFQSKLDNLDKIRKSTARKRYYKKLARKIVIVLYGGGMLAFLIHWYVNL